MPAFNFHKSSPKFLLIGSRLLGYKPEPTYDPTVPINFSFFNRGECMQLTRQSINDSQGR